MQHVRSLLLFAGSLVAAVCCGQTPFRPDHILLMNGEIIDTRVLGQSTLEIRYLEFGKDGRAAGPGVLPVFEDQGGGAFAEHQAAAAGVLLVYSRRPSRTA